MNWVWHRNQGHFWSAASTGLLAKMRMNVLTITLFPPAKLSPIANLLKNVCLFIQIVSMMQNVLSQIVPSLTWVELQYCLQNQLRYQHHLLVVSPAIASLLVRGWNVLSIDQNTGALVLSVQDLTARFIIPPLLCYHDMPWSVFSLTPVNNTQSWLAENHEVWRLLHTDERDPIELVKYLKLGIYCFYNIKKEKYKTEWEKIFSKCMFDKGLVSRIYK